MKTIRRAIVGAVLLLLTSAVYSFAVEGIQVSVQSSNVVLSWPSTTNETYIVQYLPALLSTNSWLTLTDDFPAALNTNLTVFIKSNGVQPTIWTTNTSGVSTNGGGMIPPGATNGSGVSGYSAGFYRVVRDGVHLWGLTNGMVVDNILVTTIEFAVQSTDQIVGVTFYDTNNNPLVGASAHPIASGGWVFSWNTPMVINGNYAIKAELNFATDAPVVTPPVTLTVSNAFSFPNYLTQLYGSQMWIYAQTVPNADVEIDIYDETNAYLGSFYPVSDGNGVISFIWDLTDGNGHTFTDTNFAGVFTLESTPAVRLAGSSKASWENWRDTPYPSFLTLQRAFTKPAGSPGGATLGSTGLATWQQEPQWTPNRNWVVAQADLTGNGSADQAAEYMLAGGEGSYNDYGGVLGTLYDIGIQSYPNVSPGNNAPQGNVFRLQDTTSRSNLLSYLSQRSPIFENFFFFGHGNDSSIGAYNYSPTAITMDQMAFALGNVPLSYDGEPQFDQWIDPDVPAQYVPTYPPEIRTAALHVYRFVWIEACEAGAGNFCEAFGIPAYAVSTNSFKASGLESRAFLGYTQPTGFNASYDNGWQDRSEFYNAFFDAWFGGEPYDIETLVLNAQNNTGRFQGATTYRMDPSAVYYGADDMTYRIQTGAEPPFSL